MTPRPTVCVVGGPNGAGKSTLAPVLLKDCFGVPTYVNADVIAQGLNGYDPQAVAVQAGRLMLRRLHQLADERVSFAFETTLASRGFAPWLRRLGADGYRVLLLYLWLPRVELAIQRVRDRVALGGHDIPEPVIRRRYRAGLDNLWRLYWPIADEIVLFDNSDPDEPILIACRSEDDQIEIGDPARWDALSGEVTDV